ncbi:hypothetical protein Taro_009965, partial [Colocasia esculenta]|nr:hypothetical protein [Colocasia esculenta]
LETNTIVTVPLSSFPQPDVQLKLRSEGVQVRRHRSRRYNTSTGTKPQANSLAQREPGVPNWRGRRHRPRRYTSTGTSPEHSRAWLTQNLGLPTEEVTTVGVVLLATHTQTTCTPLKP